MPPRGGEQRIKVGEVASRADSGVGSEAHAGDGRFWVKLLVTHAAAGSIIGKGGAAIGEFQNVSRARIQLSRNGETVMGTGDRLLLISGSRHCTVVALDLILRKLIREGVAPAVEQKLPGGGDAARLSTVTDAFEQLAVQHGPTSGHTDTEIPAARRDEDHIQRSTSASSDRGELEDYRLLLKLVVPGELCSCIRTVEIAELTDAVIRVTSQDVGVPGAANQIVTVSGVLQQVLAGISEVLQQVMSHPRAAQLVDLPFPFHSARGYSGYHTQRTPFMGNAVGNWQHPGFMHCTSGSGIASVAGIVLAIPDVRATSLTDRAAHAAEMRMFRLGLNTRLRHAQELVGILVGRGGCLLAELQQATAVHVQLSDRHEPVRGMPQHRTLTLTGTVEGIQYASSHGTDFVVSMGLRHSKLLKLRTGVRSCAQWMMSQRLYSVFSNHAPLNHPSAEYFLPRTSSFDAAVSPTTSLFLPEAEQKSTAGIVNLQVDAGLPFYDHALAPQPSFQASEALAGFYVMP